MSGFFSIKLLCCFSYFIVKHFLNLLSGDLDTGVGKQNVRLNKSMAKRLVTQVIDQAEGTNPADIPLSTT